MPKSIATSSFLLLFISICFISCSGKNKNDEKVITTLESSLISSNHTINRSTETLLKDLEDKTQDPMTKERAEIWYPKAVFVENQTQILYDFLEIKKSIGKITDIDLISITGKLKQFQTEILSIDQQMNDIFFNNFQFINTFIWSVGGDTLQKENKLKSNISAPSFQAVLSMIQNKIKQIENRTIGYCNTKVINYRDSWYDSYSFIIGQNSNYLKPGSKLEIKAGVGVFSRAAQPIITIRNRNIELEPEGYAIYKMKVSKTPGNYKVPVRIKYFNQLTGKEVDQSIDVEYTVTKVCDQ